MSAERESNLLSLVTITDRIGLHSVVSPLPIIINIIRGRLLDDLHLVPHVKKALIHNVSHGRQHEVNGARLGHNYYR